MWIENGHKMPKKGPIKLKFGPNVYFYVFCRFPKDFYKNFENWPIFGRKTAIFSDFRVAISVLLFRRKRIEVKDEWLE